LQENAKIKNKKDYNYKEIIIKKSHPSLLVISKKKIFIVT
jgi:hypothetical protein